MDLLHIDIKHHVSFVLTAPDMKKDYEIPLHICERKIGESSHTLIIKVVD